MQCFCDDYEAAVGYDDHYHHLREGCQSSHQSPESGSFRCYAQLLVESETHCD